VFLTLERSAVHCFYRYRLFRVHSKGPSEQNTIKNFGKTGAWAYPGTAQGLPKNFRAPIYRAHCAVVFAIAQLSCLFGYVR